MPGERGARPHALAQAQYSSNLDRSVAYLAINYLDRFISKQKLRTNDTWSIEMVNVIKYSFFLSLFKLQDPLLQHDLKARASDIIYKSQHEIKLLKSTPSIVMASTLLEASHELFPLQFSNFRNTICSPSFLFSYGRYKFHGSLLEICRCCCVSAYCLLLLGVAAAAGVRIKSIESYMVLKYCSSNPLFFGQDAKGDNVYLSFWKGYVLLIVNVVSQEIHLDKMSYFELKGMVDDLKIKNMTNMYYCDPLLLLLPGLTLIGDDTQKNEMMNIAKLRGRVWVDIEHYIEEDDLNEDDCVGSVLEGQTESESEPENYLASDDYDTLEFDSSDEDEDGVQVRGELKEELSYI
ncbi:hypothetical protein IFM89_024070 [Coptis chinensis]|uniref:PB1-like domain-containing protein n=1 Tax=Coptis chinensis TaxID=261450 RepID=A0A835LWZ3_9MAGN|nr:hypothetical protein IFM89_024070 [Coptis chinensis]